jgi:chemotaxis protein CheX
MNMLIAAAKGQRLEYIREAANDTLELPALRPQSRVALDGFVAGACEYLETHAKQLAIVGTPYVAYESNIAALEFTATIRITGARRGIVYLTASRAMLTIMLMRMGSTDITVEGMSAVLRDLAFSMAAAARRGNDEDILVREPSVFVDRTGKIECKRAARPLIVPIQWRKFTAQLVMCVE